MGIEQNDLFGVESFGYLARKSANGDQGEEKADWPCRLVAFSPG
jgi:hypothetical protein